MKQPLYLTRGDSYSFILIIQHEDGTEYELSQGDIIYFSVKRQIRSQNYAFQKVVNNFIDGKARIEIEPGDTKGLPFGQYVYDIQLTKSDGTVKTVIKPSELTMGEEVTDE